MASRGPRHTSGAVVKIISSTVDTLFTTVGTLFITIDTLFIIPGGEVHSLALYDITNSHQKSNIIWLRLCCTYHIKGKKPKILHHMRQISYKRHNKPSHHSVIGSRFLST
jgi:hypothetical protein